MATIAKREIFERELLSQLGDFATKRPAIELCGFLAMQGSKYRNELMVVGRAVNEWGEGETAGQLREPDVAMVSQQRLINRARLKVFVLCHGCLIAGENRENEAAKIRTTPKNLHSCGSFGR